MKLNPHGRTRVITELLPEDTPQNAPDEAETAANPYWDSVSHQRSPRPWRAKIPLSHGKLSEEEVQRLDDLGKKRRSGG